MREAEKSGHAPAGTCCSYPPRTQVFKRVFSPALLETRAVRAERFSTMKFMFLVSDRQHPSAASASMVRLSTRLFATWSSALDCVRFSMITVARELNSQPQLLHAVHR